MKNLKHQILLLKLTYNIIKSNCLNKYVNLVLRQSKKPCTNHPTKCELCDMTMWSYNIRSHYNAIHSEHEIPSFISDEEMNRIRNLFI